MSINSLKEISKIYLEQISEANDGNLANNYPPYGKVTRGDIISGALGQDQMGGKRKGKKQKVKEELVGNQNKIDVSAPYGKLTSADFKKLRKSKKRIAKEGFSNWREDLIEVVDKIKNNDNEKIVEKQIDNYKDKKIKINPNLGEAVENLGGTLIEMIEIDEVDYIIESVYDELLDEGYEEDDIEEALEYALVEAKVTFGHDTPEKKGRNLLGAVGRLARRKLSSKYRGAKKAVSSAAVSGLRNVAKGALGAARKIEGDKKPSKVHSKSGVRSASTYSGVGAGQRERVSSGSYTPPPKPKTKTQSQKSPDPWGEPTTPPKAKAESKPKAKTTTVAATSSPQSDKKKKAQALRLLRQNPNISADDLRRAVGEEYEINEKTLTAAETKEKERLVKSMKDKAADFEKRYPGRGKEVMYATATKMAKKIAEQSEIYVDEAKLPSSMKKGKKKVESKTQVIHDVDDNLADQRHPDAAKIDVMRKTGGSWKKVQSLTPSQFAHHKLRKPGEPVKEENDPGDKYGFDQFRDTQKFKKTTKANKPVVRLGDSPRRPAQKSVVTARGGSEFGSKKPSTPMDKPKEFAKDLKNRIGVKNLERKNVHFTGGMRSGSGPEKKGEVVKKIVKPDAKKVITTDDHLQNVRHMAAAASSVAPKAKVRAYQSRPATKARGKVKSGDIVPVRVGKEKNLSDTNIGIRSNTSPSKSPQETQKRRKQQKMGEAVDVAQTREKAQNPSAINQVLQAKAKADAAERELANKQRMATQKGVNLSSISS